MSGRRPAWWSRSTREHPRKQAGHCWRWWTLPRRTPRRGGSRRRSCLGHLAVPRCAAARPRRRTRASSSDTSCPVWRHPAPAPRQRRLAAGRGARCAWRPFLADSSALPVSRTWAARPSTAPPSAPCSPARSAAWRAPRRRTPAMTHVSVTLKPPAKTRYCPRVGLQAGSGRPHGQYSPLAGTPLRPCPPPPQRSEQPGHAFHLRCPSARVADCGSRSIGPCSHQEAKTRTRGRIRPNSCPAGLRPARRRPPDGRRVLRTSKRHRGRPLWLPQPGGRRPRSHRHNYRHPRRRAFARSRCRRG